MSIKKCKCKNDYQDQKYGKGLRVHNIYIKDGGGFRCTVCGNQTGDIGFVFTKK